MVSDDWKPDRGERTAKRERQSGPSVGSVHDAIEPETAFELLANRHRRLLLDQLAQDGSRSTIDELAAALAENQSSADSPYSVEDVKIALHHIHLPQLADAGVVQYDPQDGIVVPTAVVEPLADVSMVERKP